jgi:hypothetical protein
MFLFSARDHAELVSFDVGTTMTMTGRFILSQGTLVQQKHSVQFRSKFVVSFCQIRQCSSPDPSFVSARPRFSTHQIHAGCEQLSNEHRRSSTRSSLRDSKRRGQDKTTHEAFKYMSPTGIKLGGRL